MDWKQSHKRITAAWEKVLKAIEWEEVMSPTYSHSMLPHPSQLSVSEARPAISFSVVMDIQETEGRTDKDIENLLCRRLGEMLIGLQISIDNYLLGEGE